MRIVIIAMIGVYFCVDSARLFAAERIDHALLKGYPGAIIDGGNEKSNLAYSIAGAPMREGDLTDVLELRGKLSHLQYEIPEGESIDVVYQSYVSALADAGFTTLFTCHKKECGGDMVSALFAESNRHSDYQNVQDDVLNDENTDFYYLSTSKLIGEQQVYATIILRQITISSWPVRMTQDILEVQPLQVKEVSVNIDYQGDLTKYGKVILDGLYFDTNKASLKPQSATTLGQISSYLKANPTQRFFVVGHTDTDGRYQHNLELSMARASSVRDQLIKKYNVEQERLIAVGVGPVVPIASNANDSGKTSNRRVELVLK